LALLLGALIGLERNKRVKEAGIRTHGLVCVGACVFMLLSQFAIPRIDGVTFDAARIASTTVTGVAFLGVGIMYSKGGAMQGITTAAGIWTTVAIGMCCGAGNINFVWVACIVTVLIILFQFMFYKPLKFLAHKTEKVVRVKFVKTEDLTAESFKKYGKIIGYSVKREGEYIVCTCNVSLKNLDASSETIDQIFGESDKILSAEFIKLTEK
jgi:putative Mg2+ transporter-C (MgtC) family protein